MSDHCELNFVLDFKMSCYDTHEQEDEDCSNIKCKGKYVWDKHKTNVFLENGQSENVIEKLNSIAENLKRATSNEEVDTFIVSFTSLVENVAKPFFKISKEDHNLQNVKSNFEECEYKRIVFVNLLNK